MVVSNGYQVCVVIQSSSIERRTCWWFIMGIRYVGLYQAVAAAKKDLLLVCNGYQLCGCYVKQYRQQRNTFCWFVMGIRYVDLY